MPPIIASDITIEPARAQDLDRILLIARESFATPWTRKMFEAELTGNPFAHLVAAHSRRQGQGDEARQGTDLMGYLSFWLVFEELRLMDLAVDPAVRRRGLAWTLVSYALRFAQDRGAVRAVLEVRASNQPARALYERFAFRSLALRENYYSHPTEDAILMELALPAHS